MQTHHQNLSFSKTLNPSFPLHQFPSLKPFSFPFLHHHHNHKTLKPLFPLKPLLPLNPKSSRQIVLGRRGSDVRAMAGRSKKNNKGGGQPSGRIGGNAEFRRAIKDGARRKSKKLAESRFYRQKNSNKNHADNFTEDELQQIGFGYDRMVRFMEKDDPNLRHPYDWYKYGEYGPYSWRGVVVGDPIRGRFTDERVTLIGEVRDHEEWERIEQFEMGLDFSEKLKKLDKSRGFKYYWVFVRHPRWRISELPWQQWTLACEVVIEGGEGRIDKWSLMGRFGNKVRSLITQCAAWMRPDIIYVKKPVYQCRFEPQDDFFNLLVPYLDPKTERDFLFEVKREDGTVEMSTYYGGLCKIVKVNPKAFVDDVVNAYEKLSDERKSECLGFLLTNHPVQLLHPYTKEWKEKLEEIELGCDAPDDDEEDRGDNEIVDWIEEDDDDYGDDDVEEDDDDDDEGDVIDMEEVGDDELGRKEEDSSPEEDSKFWEEEFKNAVNSADAMEKIATRSVKLTTERYKKQLRAMEAQEEGKVNVEEDGDETALRGKWPKVSPEEWNQAGYGRWRKRIKKSKIPPHLFLRAAVRPFTYRNLVKEIVLTRHGILDGDIGSKA